MNRKQFIVLLAVVAVIAAAGWVVYQRGNSSWQQANQAIGGKLLPNLQVNDVAQISIQSATNRVIVEKTNGLWRVRERAGYPADFSRVSGVLTKLADLKIVQDEEIGPSQLGRFDLLPPDAAANGGTEVEIKDQSGKTLASVLLGKVHSNQQGGGEGWPDGRYVKTGSGQQVALISDPLDNIQPKPEDWLDKTFFRIQNPRMIEVTFPAATNSWELTRSSATNNWELADAKPGEKLDSTKIESVTSPFDSPAFDDVRAGAGAPGAADSVNVETFAGVNYAAKIWPAKDDNYLMTVSVSAPGESAKGGKPEADAGALAQGKQLANWTYEVPGYTVEPLLKTRAQLLVESNAAPASPTAGEP